MKTNQLTKTFASRAIITAGLFLLMLAPHAALADPWYTIYIDDLSDSLTVTSSNPTEYPISGLVPELEPNPTPPGEARERLTFDVDLQMSVLATVNFVKTVWTSPFDPGDIAGGGSVSDVLTISLQPGLFSIRAHFVFESADGGTINGTRIDPANPAPDQILVEDGTYQTAAQIVDGALFPNSIFVDVRSVSLPEPSSLSLLAIATLGAALFLKRK